MYLKFFSIFILKLILCLSLPVGAYSGTGGMDGGGGNAAELEFQTMGRLLSAKRSVLKAVGVDADEFAKAVKRTMVRSVKEELRKDKRDVNAKNFPDENRIIFNLTEWKDLKPLLRIAMVFHEYLGIARVERDQYRISSLLKENLSTQEVQEIASEARPFANYRCKMTEAEVKGGFRKYIDITPKNCGTATLTTRLMKKGDTNYLPFWHLFNEGGCRKTVLSLAGNGGYVDWSSTTRNVEFKIVIDPTNTPEQSSNIAFGQAMEQMVTWSYKESSMEMDVYEHPSHFKMKHTLGRGLIPRMYMGKLGTVFHTEVRCERID